ncbi:MAG: hypothetical protein JMDDDDMK_02394 [Acidobacteria bacterium]|nr:hypothetical protein [Acidobacteriota bacterium]
MTTEIQPTRVAEFIKQRAFKMIFQHVKPGCARFSADRGFPDDDLFALLDELKIASIIRVKGSVKVFHRGEWGKLNTIRFEGNSRKPITAVFFDQKQVRLV